MKRRTTAYASIAILLAIVVLMTGCNPSASKQEDAATTMMRAMSQVAASKNYSIGAQNVNYIADDGSKITGKMTIDSNGEIVAANLTITYADGTQGPNLILATDGTGKENVTIDNTPVRNPIKPISKEQAAAMAIFLEGFEEAYDELQEYFTDDDFFNGYTASGTHTIERRDYWPEDMIVEGTITLREEKDDDDDEYEIDLEVSAVNIKEFVIPLPFGASMSGSFSYREERNSETVSMNVNISNYPESEDEFRILLADVNINATIEEGETWDDYFKFNGSLGGTFSINRGPEQSISFTGTIDAMEDHYFRFPEYSLTINGERVALEFEKSRK